MGKHLFKLDNNHNITVYGGGAVECGTCALSWVVHNAVLFMVQFQVTRMTVQGADLVMVY